MAGRAQATPWRIIPSLALADMRHESILTLCMVVALVAIIAPLMLLLGLRYGAIDMLRSRLVENPTYREIWPTATLNLNDAWFEDLRRRPDVEFLIPTILRGASIIGVRSPKGSKTLAFDLIPTATGDPLLVAFGSAVPGSGQVVLSQPAAEQLGGVADRARIALEVTRQRAGRREGEDVPAEVIGVLPFEADGLQRVYAPLDLATAVERYREGMAVPQFGWPGQASKPYLSFDGVIVAVPQPLESLAATALRIGTGFSSVDVVSDETFAGLTGLPRPARWSIYDVRTAGAVVLVANLDQLRDKLRGLGAIVLPYVRPMTVDMEGAATRLVGLSLGEQEAVSLNTRPTPWGTLNPERTAEEALQVSWPRDEPARRQDLTNVSYSYGDYKVSFPLRRAGTSPVAWVPTELLAMLKTGAERRIAWDSGLRQFVVQRRGYFGFRLYATSIDRVPDLYRALIAQNLRVDAHVQEIERIRVLDRGLLRLFLMIATVGVLGGSCAMVASLYASVDRKKRELGVMRLLGLSRLAVSTFPVFQGAALSVIAVLLAAGTFLTFSLIINFSFADEIVAGGRICHLPARYYAYVGGSTIAAALVSSLAAARRATRIEPAEAIREE